MGIAKTWMFIIGLVIFIVSAAGVAISLGFTFSILATFPANPIVYLVIDGILGLILLFLGLQGPGFM